MEVNNMKTGTIYIIKNTINSKVYIGQTTMELKQRFITHMKPSTLKQKGNYKFYQAIKDIGKNNFYIEPLEEHIPLSKLNEKEIFYISKFNSFKNGYNSNKGGEGRLINIENEEEVLNMAKQGFSAIEISEKLHVHKATVLRTLHKLGFKYYSSHEEDIIKLSSLGLSNNEIAKKLNVHSQTVSRTLDRNNCRKNRKPVSLRKDFDFQSVINDYVLQLPISDICEKHNISRTTFYRILKKFNVSVRPKIK